MNTTQTPGPWSFRPLGPHKQQDRAVYCGARRIASIPHPDRIEPNEENDANARLIAAAPELLEALQYLTSNISLGKLNIRKDFSLINAHACATKAIAKATAP